MTPAELDTLVEIVAEAAILVRSIYERPFKVDYKGPFDPVTDADRKANELICRRLGAAFPDAVVVAEESRPEEFEGFRSAERVLFVDPVDGTREFVERNGEFVVMVGMLEADLPVGAVIHAPAHELAWAGLVGEGAFELAPGGSRRPIRVSTRGELENARIVSSRSHRTEALERALIALGAARTRAIGSAGLKGSTVATGEAEAYVAPFHAGKRWDVCPTDALVTAAGGKVTDVFGRQIDYRAPGLSNDAGLVASNGLLHDAIVRHLVVGRSPPPE